MQGQLDLSFGQVQLEPHLSIGQVEFNIFLLTLLERKEGISRESLFYSKEYLPGRF